MFNNVEVIYSSTSNISFDDFNQILKDLLPHHLKDIEVKGKI
jgi:hypothetical protein